MEKNVIWKYPIELGDKYKLELPAHVEILHLDVQNNLPFIWVKVNPFNKGEKRKFITYGTGQAIEDEENLIYIGTFTLENWLVQHLFEII